MEPVVYITLGILLALAATTAVKKVRAARKRAAARIRRLAGPHVVARTNNRRRAARKGVRR
ncbi:hypothetical protein HDA32_004725 [Spinactinospora alkalitolerans]|uniref:Uncharacterized protein n=1 Tax=Spinactinospora alkalitolerans TaxID=687207 RepID=A0A852U241_9ACTN|nr:hypothetical protein [Spinactinospora alkalitolerans]NYE49605.1 hypothetical protein [Spinactinospora alkalitolerans]